MSDPLKDERAFPYIYEDRTKPGVVNTIIVPGMSLRDYFAAAALQGLVSVLLPKGEKPADFPEKYTIEDWQRHYAKVAYGYADTMLAARRGT